MGAKQNSALPIIALVIAIAGCVIAVRLHFLQATPLSEETILALIEKKTSIYVAEDKVKEMVTKFTDRLGETTAKEEALERQVGELDKRLQEAEKLRTELEEKERNVQQLARNLQKSTAKERELDERITKLEEKELNQRIAQLEEGERQIEQVGQQLREESPFPFSEEKVSALIEEKTKTYLTEEKIEKMVEQLTEKLAETAVKREEFEQRVSKLEMRDREVEWLGNELEGKGETIEQLARGLEKVALEGKELGQRVTQLEGKTEFPEIKMVRDTYRISLLRSSVNQADRNLEDLAQYVVVIVDGEKIMQTHIVPNTFSVK